MNLRKHHLRLRPSRLNWAGRAESLRSDLGPKACLSRVAQAGTPARVSRRESGTVSSKERSQAPTRLRESSAAADSGFFAINHEKKYQMTRTRTSEFVTVDCTCFNSFPGFYIFFLGKGKTNEKPRNTSLLHSTLSRVGCWWDFSLLNTVSTAISLKLSRVSIWNTTCFSLPKQRNKMWENVIC